MTSPLCGRGSMPARPSRFTESPERFFDYGYDEDLGLRLPNAPRWADCPEAGIEDPDQPQGVEVERLARAWAPEGEL